MKPELGAASPAGWESGPNRVGRREHGHPGSEGPNRTAQPGPLGPTRAGRRPGGALHWRTLYRRFLLDVNDRLYVQHM